MRDAEGRSVRVSSTARVGPAPSEGFDESSAALGPPSHTSPSTHTSPPRLSSAHQGFPRVFGWLGEQGIAPVVPPFIRYRTFDASWQPRRIEIAAPVAEAVAGDEPVVGRALPAGRWLSYLHRGPYTHASEPDLEAAHASMHSWADEHGFALAQEQIADGGVALGGCTEHYRVGPLEQPDYSRWETELAYLIG